MESKNYKENFGEPSIKIEGLQIWIHGRERSNSKDFWDGNWLRAIVHCSAGGADVWVSGSILHLSELDSWLQDLEMMNTSLSGEANLKCMEPGLHIEMKIESLGQILMKVETTPDNLKQYHSFEFDVDQSYLPFLIKNLKEVLEKYPIHGEQSR